MRGIRLILRQQVIEAMLRIFWQQVREFDTQAAESRGSNRYQQSRNRLPLFAQVSDAFVNQISSG